ncbi:MAG: bifunctional ADP-dependent NAD(P)H-hydrate dehydratase/NAD(P)H-hydrate epimerase [Longibaculum muris]|uniref:Bifunctional NAD(P)H-hydrate repair enzyme n=1 Tax=Longibaculum muris TaxID=1796628 RepID=A0A4V2W5D9_9FIRM|nr:bifunctional ADP-dependent NAD(P)H-hydrate dehydratase/NAD(P)H-hydrate epimerase [Longibaculum muris]KXU51693.1 YjeF domain protein [Candidatus Stoquefichus sp. KLE1796]MCR1888420.1 bifunctional ADP-dependent NAD(P)H-hydrate dehydratase/NAD(P)H-hydrate epimerase [Longibaculum muris]MED9813363.1 bifunctional ADP-dependent NAD(P)H-hydrate dehydratase/NAD(P)H-hydrate epimerase [Longibaculum muris]TCV99368.1 NAD(P)H-hydrate epimerase [Longibaculum muris]
MKIGSSQFMKQYDEYLLNHGYQINELVDKASDCLIKHMHGQRYCLLCGPGNNGADGLSLAIKLFLQGKQVTVYIFEDQNHLSQANRYYLDQCYALNLEVILLNEDILDEVILHMKDCDIIVDAMFGNGLNSSPRGLYQMVIEQINQLYDQEIIAVDIPTGLNCDNGKPYQSVVCATQTITLTALKNGFLNPDSTSFTGQVIVEELDVEDVSEEVGLYQLADQKMMCSLLKERRFDGHKGDYGRTLLITGCHEYKGASLLSAKSCVYSGSGVVTVMSEQAVIDALTVYCPEVTTQLRPAVMRKEDFLKYQAILIGCGLGQSIDSYRHVIDVFSMSHQPLVVDADALTILSSNLDLLKNQERDIILTPHMGEFRRLCEFDEHSDMLFVARNFALKHHVILVLKGPYTIVTDGQESYRIFAGNKAMASGGMGDTLAGIITSLLGQGYGGLQAAMLGVYIHGRAGDCLANDAYTIIPSKLIDVIPQTMLQMIYEKNDLS